MEARVPLLQLLATLLVSQVARGREAGSTLTQTRFLRCAGVPAANSTSSLVVRTKSSLECSILCSLTQLCWGVTACVRYHQDGQRAVECHMWQWQTWGGAGQPFTSCPLAVHADDDCRYLRKDTEMTDSPTSPPEETTMTAAAQPTTVLVCQNGGSVNGDSCRCPSPYAGRMCERYMRDCTEGFDHGNTQDGAYLIQPVGVASPFKVKCNYQVSIGVTQVMIRTATVGQWHNRTWQEVKAGFGEDLSSKPDSWNFFLGLEKLHQISRQALYSFHIFFYWGSSKDGCASYKNFTIGSEASNYRMDYDAFYKLTNPGEVNYLLANNPADDGFNNTAPRSFSTSDNDLDNCFATNGAVGWYDSDCTGMSVFSNSLQWPVGGQNKSLLWVMLNFVRESDYY